MAEALKTFFSPDLVRRLAADIGRARPGFDSEGFVHDACIGLDALELLDRGRHIAEVLARHLPANFTEAIEILLSSLGPEHGTDELLGAGMGPFFYLPHVTFVADRGLEHFEASMRAQVELTKRFSAEFSIRPFIEKYPERTMRQMHMWATDKNAHVRRLVSEGTRLRLPWAMRVRWLDANPHQVLKLLELLRDDPSTMVRRSVANNLNDLGKVHPKLLYSTCAAWLKGASAERRALVEHALRGAVKRGEPQALKLLGYGRNPQVKLETVRFQPKRVVIGERVKLTFVLRSTSKHTQELLVDVAVFFVKKNSRTTPKVFKLKRLTIAPGEPVELATSFSLAVHTTRKPNQGFHKVEIIINGQRIDAGGFNVAAARK